MYIVASSVQDDLDKVRRTFPDIWRQIRRFNRPVQLAIAAGIEVALYADAPETATLISVAPSHPGSPEIFSWAHHLMETRKDGDFSGAKMNPTHTLHAVDNLALSSLAIALRNHSYCIGLGGSPGQSWEALQMALEKNTDADSEVILVAGDQENALSISLSAGVAFLLSSKQNKHVSLMKSILIKGILHSSLSAPVEPDLHSAKGFVNLAAFISRTDGFAGTLTYDVPPEQGNGAEQFTIVMELS